MSSLTVVLPLEPVTPIHSVPVRAERAAAAMAPSAAATSGTTRVGAPIPPSGRAASTSVAPRSTAAAAWSWPSARSPLRQANSVPGWARRLSMQAPRRTTASTPAQVPPVSRLASAASRRNGAGSRASVGTGAVAITAFPPPASARRRGHPTAR